MEDHYTTLGVERTATAEDIKRAYRRLAHQHHPDKDGGDEEKFKQVNAAYQILSDEQKRAQYDQFGQTFEDGAGPGGFNPFGGQRVNVNVDDLGDIPGVGDIFEQFFGGRPNAGARTANRGRDVAVDTTITFEQSAKGFKQDIKHRLYQKCTKCSGNGAEPGTPIKDCTTCEGRGVVSTTRQTMLGVFTQNTVCPTCHGEGKQAETPCTQCRGQGRELRDREITVEIPAGIADGQTIRLSGKGEASPHGGTVGDLYVTIHVKPHPKLKRSGDNVRSTITIPFTAATLGTTVEVVTLDGKQQLKIPAGTQPNDQHTLKNHGFPHLSGASRGDHVVTVAVTIPKKLSRKQRQLLEELSQVKEKKGLFG